MRKTFFPIVAAALILSACAGGEEALYLDETEFSALPGWERDAAAEVLPALARSCARILEKDDDADFGAGGFAGKAGPWKRACETLPENADDETARAWIESAFTPYALYGGSGREGLFTGYYEPSLQGSLEKKPPYETPLYARPDTLVTADLGAFLPELAGRTVTGRVAEGKFIPFFTRADIEAGKMAPEEPSAAPPVIVWVDDPVDAFFLHIQGSGRVTLEDGEVLRVGYAAQNGHAYTAIGRELIKRGALTRENVSMQSIRAWLEANPDGAAEVMNINESYVFFRALEGEGPLGAEGVALTPRRSLAVDRKKIPYGAPVFIDAEHPDPAAPRLQRLMIAQDTGGAIRGAVRGDYFWGAGEEAAENAGRMKSRGAAAILLPKSAAIPPEKKWRWWRALFAAGGKPAL